MAPGSRVRCERRDLAEGPAPESRSLARNRQGSFRTGRAESAHPATPPSRNERCVDGSRCLARSGAAVCCLRPRAAQARVDLTDLGPPRTRLGGCNRRERQERGVGRLLGRGPVPVRRRRLSECRVSSHYRGGHLDHWHTGPMGVCEVQEAARRPWRRCQRLALIARASQVSNDARW
jgi:hypothetical protein